MYSVCVLSCVTVSHVEVSVAMKTNRIQNCCITTRISHRVLLDSHSPASMIPNPRGTTNLIYNSQMLSFQECYRRGLIQYVTYRD